MEESRWIRGSSMEGEIIEKRDSMEKRNSIEWR